MLASFIIPISNMLIFEGFYAQILCQNTFSQFEFVLILDSENTDQIKALERFKNKCGNNNLKTIQGIFNNPGGARNAGISKAKGEWLIFLDSDDLPNLNLFEKVLKKTDKLTNIIISQYDVYDIRKQFPVNIKRYSVLPNWFQFVLNPGIWRIAFRNEIFNTVRFPESRMGEDQSYIGKCLLRRPREVKFLDEVVYQYMIGREDQLTAKKSVFHDLDISIDDLYSDFISHKEQSIISLLLLIKMIITKNIRTHDKKRRKDLYIILKCLSHYFVDSVFNKFKKVNLEKKYQQRDK